jgi:hypothetical protein
MLAVGCTGGTGARAVSPAPATAAKPRTRLTVSQLGSPTQGKAATVAAAPLPVAADWFRLLPTRAADVNVGDLVWAALVTADGGVDLEPCRVIAVVKTTVNCIDQNLVSHVDVPAPLLHRVGDHLTVRVGDLVTAFDWRHDISIALVTRRDAWGQLVVKFRDSLEVVREEPANVVEHVPKDVAPMAWVAFPMSGSSLPTPPMLRGLVFALEGSKAFVRDASARVWVVDVSEAKPLTLTTKPHEVGDDVIAYDGREGYRHGQVARVFMEGFAYGVTFGDERVMRRLYFSDFVDSL